MGNADLWDITKADDPIVATAIHDGHELRSEVAERMALSSQERLREEDPFTGGWTAVANTRVVAHRSRFEVDLNRPREKAVYRKPEDAWGLHVWKDELPDDVAARSLDTYDAFHREMHSLIGDLVKAHGVVIIVDLHTYNHRREGPDGPPADPQANPEVNIGTGTLDRARWGSVIDRFMNDLARHDFLGRGLDVRENVKFRGGNFARWVHETFPESVCDIAVEFKKFFMDEWSGEPDRPTVDAIGAALEATLPGLRAEQVRLSAGRR